MLSSFILISIYCKLILSIQVLDPSFFQIINKASFFIKFYTKLLLIVNIIGQLLML